MKYLISTVALAIVIVSFILMIISRQNRTQKKLRYLHLGYYSIAVASLFISIVEFTYGEHLATGIVWLFCAIVQVFCARHYRK